MRLPEELIRNLARLYLKREIENLETEMKAQRVYKTIRAKRDLKAGQLVTSEDAISERS